MSEIDLSSDAIRLALKNVKISGYNNIIVLESINSTNSYLLDLEKSHAPHGTFVITKQQTAGRGRIMRTWLMENGDIACSLLIRSPHVPQPPSILGLMPAVAVVEALRDCGIEAYIKWPNDIVYCNPQPHVRVEYFDNYLKTGGLLIENVMRKGILVASVIGIGINISSSPGHHLMVPHRGYLSHIKPGIERFDVLIKLLGALSHHIEAFSDPHYQVSLHERYVRACASLGRELKLVLNGEEVTGRGHSILLDGALCLEREGVLQTIHGGEVNFCT